MKLVSFTHHDAPGIGVLRDDDTTVAPVLGADGALLGPTDVPAVLAATMERGEKGLTGTGEPIDLVDLRLQAPIALPPRNVFCVGRNYVEHSEEFSRSGYDTAGTGALPDAPIVFTKPRSTIIGPDAEVDPHLHVTDSLDYEAELAVVIGRPGKGIRTADAWDHVWGLTLVNDITARDLQQRHKQWFLGKCLDTFLPMGPFAATLDEVERETIVLEGRVNGELRQQASVKDLIFDIPTIVSTLSAGMALEVGDVIATGTPAGVGLGFDPPRFLIPGDVVEVTGTGLGSLRNTIATPVATP